MGGDILSRPGRRARFALAAFLAAASLGRPLASLAEDGDPPKPQALPQGGASPGSADSIPTDKPKLRAFCADRPAQATLPCTVDKGHFQLETDLFSATYDSSGGAVTDTYLFTNPTLKLGLADRTDVEVNIAPYEEVRTHEPGASSSQTLYGPSDLIVRLKQNFFGDYRGPLALAVEPFVKVPTARAGIGNGAWEGGVVLPIAAAINKSIILNLSPEVDISKDMFGGGVHLAPVEIINVTWSLPKNLTLSTELYAREDQDPVGVVTQCSADVALSLGLRDDLELDVGTNLGLNSQTPSVVGYIGMAKRF